MRPRCPAPLPWLAVLVCALGLPACSETPPQGEAAVGFIPDTKPAPPIRWVDATVEAGTRLALTMVDRVGSDSGKRGDSFKARLAEALVQGDMVVLPAGSTVYGVVARVTPAGTGFKNRGGSMVLAFSRITTPTGAGADLSARLAEIGRPAGAESFAAITGTAEGGPELVRLLGRDPNDPVLAGAAPATTIASGSRGRDAVLEADTPIDIVLERPLRIKVKR